ncbi:MAG: helix-turn-helix domain-containing protein [Atopobiaceae bacterium]|nr:helix-turn-helix domain-containing protein [Atopobiaceae bacterium]
MPHTQVDESKLAYRAYLNTQRGWSHHTHDEDMKQYHLMQAGDPAAVEESERIIRSGMPGTLSPDPVRNMKYLFVCTATIATRFAIEGGMEAEEAYNASDLYIQRMDRLQDVEEVIRLRTDMMRFFTERMANIKKEGVYSRPVVLAQDHIRAHLSERIHVDELADVVGLNASYLSTLFRRETGLTITDYVAEERIATAKNMLRYSEMTAAAIATSLGFSTQSYFTKVFREHTGFTPSEFRKRFFRESGLGSA